MFERILIVDDESAARMALATLLRREGFDVRDVSDGAAALAECASFRPDLILLDIVMPGVDGFEVCRRIKATPETRLTPVVLITGLSATEDRIKGINAGADDFLSKPIDFNELLARTRSLLRLKQYTDELETPKACFSASPKASKRAIRTPRGTANASPKCRRGWEKSWACRTRTSRRSVAPGRCTTLAKSLCRMQFC